VINQWVNQRYEVVEKSGEGPLFTVYKAREKGTSRIVALKAVHPVYAAEGEFFGALKAGLEATANLNHPNITVFQEFSTTEDGQPFAVVEFVRGINLKERVRRIAPFTLSVAVDYACAVTEALHYAHTVGQVHGDLRPQNIIISPEGAVKVTDFGVQQAIAVSPQAQQAVLRSSAPYHAPELSMKLPGSVSGDIYALGAILYEMLTGTPVYAADSPEALADQHAFAVIPSPRVINPGVPRAVEGIILKCLQKRPEQRYRAVADLLNDLKAVRDALRFGKSLSWTPLDAAAVPEPQLSTPVKTPTAAPKTAPAPAPKQPMEPVASVAASSQAVLMPSRNRLRAQDERVSLYIKIALGTVTAVILVCLIGLYAIYLSNWALPKPIPIPSLVGKDIDEVRQIVASKKVHLIEHPDYADKPRNIVYRTDIEPGEPIRASRPLNVWYSKGPEYVDVPNLVGMSREEAEQKLTAVGLKVGKISPQYDNKVPVNNVISQDVTFKKRVFHDTPVDMVISDGPKPDENAPVDPILPNGDTPPNDPGNSPSSSGDTSGTTTDAGADASQSHMYDRSVTLVKDGQGSRRVRVEYKDAQGEHPPVVDETHNEGDVIPVKFDYFGKTITLRIYYENKMVKELTFDPQATRKRTL
jgi:serine/threonine protein kinase/beta-lactam-binding protein with PASTA domain